MTEQRSGTEALLWILRQKEALSHDHIGALSPGEWKAFCEQAHNGSVAPIVYKRLFPMIQNGLVPSEVAERLHISYLETSSKNLLLYHELSRILEVLQQENIQVILLKGAHLADTVYENISLRPMYDIDLLVREVNYQQAIRRMFKSGYRPVRMQRGEFLARHVVLTSEHNVIMELHKNISPDSFVLDIDLEGIWNRSRPKDGRGPGALIMEPEDLLLHLCIHTAYQHSFTHGLLSACDIQAVLRHPACSVDWDVVSGRAEAWNVTKGVFLALFLAKKLVGAPVPSEILQRLRPSDLRPERANWAMEHALRSDGKRRDISANLARLWGDERVVSRIGIGLKRAFPAPAELVTRYSLRRAWLAYLFYPVHIANLLRKHGRNFYLMLCRDRETLSHAELVGHRGILREWMKPD